eukprot:UN0074
MRCRDADIINLHWPRGCRADWLSQGIFRCLSYPEGNSPHATLYCVFGGGEEFGISSDAWNHLAHLWPGAVFSLGPVTTALRFCFTTLAQMSALLCAPHMLLSGRPGASLNSVIIGWSLGTGVADITASILRSLGHCPLAVVLVEGRIMPPQPKWSTWVSRELFRRLGPMRYSKSALATRRDFMYLGMPPSRMRSTCTTLEILSALQRAAEWQWFFQSEADVSSRREAYSSALTQSSFPETDHYIVGLDHAWDIGRWIRLEAG